MWLDPVRSQGSVWSICPTPPLQSCQSQCLIPGENGERAWKIYIFASRLNLDSPKEHVSYVVECIVPNGVIFMNVHAHVCNVTHHSHSKGLQSWGLTAGLYQQETGKYSRIRIILLLVDKSKSVWNLSCEYSMSNWCVEIRITPTKGEAEKALGLGKTSKALLSQKRGIRRNFWICSERAIGIVFLTAPCSQVFE